MCFSSDSVENMELIKSFLGGFEVLLWNDLSQSVFKLDGSVGLLPLKLVNRIDND